jgi:tripartite-type tricarboxylate transporter receptor subunit TctC
MRPELCATRRLLLASLAATRCLARPARAQERKVRIIAPIAPGGLTDGLARLLAGRFSDRTGQTFLVENRPGAAGIIGMEAAARAAPNGGTLVLVYQGVASVNPVLYQNLPYDTLRDFRCVGLAGSFPILLTVPADLPVRDAAEFIALARRQPGALSYGSAGNATTAHLAMELFKRRAAIDIVHVPYRGEAPALADLAGGRIAAVFATVAAAKPVIDSGRVRAIGVASPRPSALAPGMPAIAASGLPGFEARGWYGVLAPRNTPEPLAARLNVELRAILAERETQQHFAAMGLEPSGSTPEACEAWIREETARWREVIAAAGIRVE